MQRRRLANLSNRKAALNTFADLPVEIQIYSPSPVTAKPLFPNPVEKEVPAILAR